MAIDAIGLPQPSASTVNAASSISEDDFLRILLESASHDTSDAEIAEQEFVTCSQ